MGQPYCRQARGHSQNSGGLRGRLILMAKIELSALLNTIRGRLGDVIYAHQRGTSFVKLVSTTFVDPHTTQQLRIRKNLSDLSSAFVALGAGEKDLWREWANLKHRRGGARSAYISVNANLLNASHSDLVAISSPPSIPGTPKFPRHFCVTVLSPTQVCLAWSAPDDTLTYVTGHYKLDRWFCGNHPCWGLCPTTGHGWSARFFGTVRADTLQIQHVHSWPASTKLYYWLNSIDKKGRKSPITYTVMVTSPA